MNTRTYILSSSTLTIGKSGDNVYADGITNFVLSFSGVNEKGKYLKFLVEYVGDPKIYVIQDTSNIYNVKDQTISRTFYPSESYRTTHTVDVSGLKNDLSIDLYRVHLRLGKSKLTNYKDLKIINSHLYTNREGSNYVMLTVEGQAPQHCGNLVIPYTKDRDVYLPAPVVPFIPNDNTILRAEIWTFFGYPSGGAYMPIVTEKKVHQIISEQQYIIRTFGCADQLHLGRDSNFVIEASTVGTSSIDVNGEIGEDAVYLIPEDGTDYQYTLILDSENFNKPYVPNVKIDEIYPGGVKA